jgi:tRNA1Val (adenine37-N6)-methyltransferase
MGSVFKFKQFQVDQSGCAMKINTDGVLLAAVVNHGAPMAILDVGTGTGVIAMMLAQRFPLARVDAVEVEEQAANQASTNMKASPFADRLRAIHADVLDFNVVKRYDLIVSNPPFFVNDLKSTELKKGIARHTDESFFIKLLMKVSFFLSAEGAFWLILPVKQAQWLVDQAVLFNLFPRFIYHIHSDEDKPEIRQIICLSFNKVKVEECQLFIYESRGVYTETYKSLLQDFFLAF